MCKYTDKAGSHNISFKKIKTITFFISSFNYPQVNEFKSIAKTDKNILFIYFYK